MDTGRGTSHTRTCWRMGRLGEEYQGVGDWEGITLGERPNVDDELMGAANNHGTGIPM